MSVHFTHGRLHVGYRRQDWTDVWYEPIGEPNEEGEAELGLFRYTHGEAGPREPMNGQTLWHPAFDIANCESKVLLERRRMQLQFLTDAWRYLSEKSAPKVLEMERQLDQPGFSRWQKWFSEAKKWKKIRMRATARRVAAKKAAGANVDSDDTEDSAYDSSEDLFVGDGAPDANGAAPSGTVPPRPTVSGRKRQSNAARDATKMPPPKRPHINPTSNAAARPFPPAPVRAVDSDADDSDDESSDATAGADDTSKTVSTGNNNNGTTTSSNNNNTTMGNGNPVTGNSNDNAVIRPDRSAFWHSLYPLRATPSIQGSRVRTISPSASSRIGEARVQHAQPKASGLNGGLDEDSAVAEAMRRSMAPESKAPDIISLRSSDEISHTNSPEPIVIDDDAPNGDDDAAAEPKIEGYESLSDLEM